MDVILFLKVPFPVIWGYWNQNFSSPQPTHSCSNHSNLEMEAEFPPKNLPYLNLNISRTKHLPCFHFICEAPWTQIFVFLQLMWCQEQSSLSDSRAFQPQGGEVGWRGGLNRKNMRKNIKIWPLNPYYKRSDWKSWLSE